MNQNNSPTARPATRRSFKNALVESPVKDYYLWWLTGFIVTTFGSEVIGGIVRSMLGKPVIAETVRQSMLGDQLNARAVLTLGLFGGLLIYGLLLLYARVVETDQKALRILYGIGLVLLVGVTIYQIGVTAYAIYSV